MWKIYILFNVHAWLTVSIALGTNVSFYSSDNDKEMFLQNSFCIYQIPKISTKTFLGKNVKSSIIYR